MSKRIDLIIIDPQQDFCDPDGALFVRGADEDMKRLTAMVNRLRSKLSFIHVTLDSHHFFDVAHPIYWKDSNGQHPNPSTTISADDVENGVWAPTHSGLYKRSLEYVKTLEKNGRYPLRIWPPHCLIGSANYAVVPELFEELKAWEQERISIVNYVIKGSNPFTEHYSAVCADCPDPQDPSTQINTRFIEILAEADTILVAGEAGSHCVSETMTDIFNNFSDQKCIEKIVLLTDAMSPIPGFEQKQDEFIKKAASRGAKISTTINPFKEN